MWVARGIERSMSSVLRCTACRAFVQAGDKFCWSCGSELGRVATASGGNADTFQQVTELEPELAVLLRRAYLAQQRRQLDEAEGYVREVLARQPDAVPALSMLAGILRAKGDLIGAVAASQQVSEVALSGKSPPGAVDYAREERARIEEQIVREMSNPYFASDSPFGALQTGGAEWFRSRPCYWALVSIGLTAMLLALAAVLHGALSGFSWFGFSLVCAGWCYSDLQARRRAGLLWVPFVLCLGPFGLTIYLLVTH